MANRDDEANLDQPEVLNAAGLARRRLLRHAAWVAPAIVGTATVRARAQVGSCNPNCEPAGPCSPVLD